MLALLDEAVTDSDERGAARVQLAILTLSAGNADRLLANIDTAQKDWRDVLYAAEYPPSDEERVNVQRLIDQLRQGGRLTER